MSYLVYLTSKIQVKSRKSPKKRYLLATNEFTSSNSYLEEERETNSSNDSLPIIHSEANPDCTNYWKKRLTT